MKHLDRKQLLGLPIFPMLFLQAMHLVENPPIHLFCEDDLGINPPRPDKALLHNFRQILHLQLIGQGVGDKILHTVRHQCRIVQLESLENPQNHRHY